MDTYHDEALSDFWRILRVGDTVTAICYHDTPGIDAVRIEAGGESGYAPADDRLFWPPGSPQRETPEANFNIPPGELKEILPACA